MQSAGRRQLLVMLAGLVLSADPPQTLLISRISPPALPLYHVSLSSIVSYLSFSAFYRTAPLHVSVSLCCNLLPIVTRLSLTTLSPFRGLLCLAYVVHEVSLS
jgi:hypothetical protein